MGSKSINIPQASPERVFSLRETAFACDLFITAVSYFDFFNWLAKNPADITNICRELIIKERPADVMLTLFKAYGFIEEKAGKLYLTDIAKSYLQKGSNFDLSSYVSSLMNRPICSDMKRVLETGKPANWAAAKDGKAWAAAMEDEAFAKSFSSGMNSRGAYLASGVVKTVKLNDYKKLLDVGGASGIYTCALVNANPNLTATVFEKPPVDKVAKYSINKLGLNDKISVVAGDIFNDNLPKGYDIHFISHVLHDWDIKEARVIIRNSYHALESGGMIILHDAHINRDKSGPISVAEYSVLLMFLSEGKCYSISEMEELLKETGFTEIKYKPTILNRSIITAKKK
jgi:2-polyprenyl-3-methyl-5-hydroxy-6-metoxy-1,4-benzoquinol methylase